MAGSRKSASGQRPNKTILSRTLILMLVCGVAAFSVLVVRLYQVMIRDHDYYQGLAVEQQTRETKISASRGTIYDANGNVLAMSATAYNIFVSPYELSHNNEDAETVAKGLSEILGVDEAKILDKFKNSSSWYETVATKVEADVADKVRKFKTDGKYTSVHIENDSKRYYPYSTLASNVIGFVGTDNSGLEGLEAYYNSYLKGTDGSVVRLTTANGTDLLYDNYQSYNDAVNGDDLKSTIDVTVENIAEKYLDQAVKDNMIRSGGCCIVMNVKTGAILAMANANGCDLNSPWTVSDDVQAELSKITDATAYNKALGEAQQKQWRNVALADTYEPGSVFKIITMSMGLNEGIVNENSSFYCGGTTSDIPGRDVPLHCWKDAGHGSQTLRQAAENSCNIAFAHIGMQIGGARFYDYVDSFGLFDKTGIDLGGEGGSIWWDRSVFVDPQNQSQLASASFGQTFNVTPIQMISAVSAAVNGGKLMEPYVVSEITDPSGNVVYSKEPTVVRQVVSEETSKTVCSILESVVSEGTGKNAKVAGYRIGGKTGTTTKTSKEAETGQKEYMVSFCGIAPMDDPEVAVLLVLDNPAPSSESGIYISGGVMAAPAVGGILSEVLPYLGIQPEYSAEELENLDVTMPKVTGQTLENAKTQLAAQGLEVRVVGEGTEVTDQLPASGASIANGSKVILYAGAEKESGEATVPGLNGLSVSAARNTLSDAGLFMETSGAPPTGSSIVVSSQSMAAGEKVEYGTVVRVTLVDSSNNGNY